MQAIGAEQGDVPLAQLNLRQDHLDVLLHPSAWRMMLACSKALASSAVIAPASMSCQASD